MALSIRLEPCEIIRPAPRALWPTSLLPMSSSLARPTDVPCVHNSVLKSLSSKLSSTGVNARVTALPGWSSVKPTPSITINNNGPLRPLNVGWVLRFSFIIKTRAYNWLNNSPARARKACPRWLTAFFCSALS